MNKSFQPTATDIASYVQVIDRNRNGKVTVEELENFIIRYFYNPNRGWFMCVFIILTNFVSCYTMQIHCHSNPILIQK